MIKRIASLLSGRTTKTTFPMKNLRLTIEDSQTIANDLNQLLSSYQIHYQNLRGLHWNITGRKFFELHLKFEELYTEALVRIDEIAERILTLGHHPLHTFHDYISHSAIQETSSILNGQESVERTLSAFETLLQLEYDLLQKSSAADDEGTNAMISDYIKQNEKTRWMLNAWLKE